MVDFNVAGFQQTVDVDGLNRVGAFALLLAVEPPFLTLDTVGRLTEMLGKQHFVLVVSVAVLALLFLDFSPLVQRAG